MSILPFPLKAKKQAVHDPDIGSEAKGTT